MYTDKPEVTIPHGNIATFIRRWLSFPLKIFISALKIPWQCFSQPKLTAGKNRLKDPSHQFPLLETLVG